MEQAVFETGPAPFSSRALPAFLLPNNAYFSPEEACSVSFSPNSDLSGLVLSGMESDAHTFQLRNGQLTPPPADKTTSTADNMQPPAFYQFNAATPPTITSSWSCPSPKPDAPKLPTPPIAGTEQQRQKRQKLLARNRVAASRCRHRKKEKTKQLQTLCEEVMAHKKKLEGQTDELRNKVSSLKNELLKHAQCGDQAINMHLERMVSQVRNKNPGIPESPQLSAPDSSPQEGSMQMSLNEVDDAIRRGSVFSMTTDTSGFSDGVFDDLVDIP